MFDFWLLHGVAARLHFRPSPPTCHPTPHQPLSYKEKHVNPLPTASCLTIRTSLSCTVRTLEDSGPPRLPSGHPPGMLRASLGQRIFSPGALASTTPVNRIYFRTSKRHASSLLRSKFVGVLALAIGKPTAPHKNAHQAHVCCIYKTHVDI